MTARVCAVVLTYNRQHLLRGCLNALQAQERSPDCILVVDNASVDGTPDMLRREYPGVELLVLRENVGAAGGFVAGMQHALEQHFDWLWVMDDDAYPRPDALAQLLAHEGEADVLVPWQCSQHDHLYGAYRYTVRPRVPAAREQGEPGRRWLWRPAKVEPEQVDTPQEIDLFAFIGPLISRRAIHAVGLPFADYFMDFFDWEYSLRLREHGHKVLLVPSSVIDHEVGRKVPRRVLGVGPERLRYTRSAWMNYYDTRNRLLTIRRRSLGGRGYLWYLANQTYFALNDVLYEPDRWWRLKLRALGVVDGWRVQSGERRNLAAPSTHKAERVTPGRIT